MNKRSIPHIVVLLALEAIACVGQEPGNMHPTSLEYGLGLVKDSPLAGFTEIEYTNVPQGVRRNSEYYLTQFLESEALPWAEGRFLVRKHIASSVGDNDLLEYRWEFRGRSLRLVESVNAARLTIPLASADTITSATEFISRIIRLRGVDPFNREYNVALKLQGTLTVGAQFSTNPQQNIRTLSSWHERLDGVVGSAGFELLFYKKVPQLMGYQPAVGWLSNDAPRQ